MSEEQGLTPYETREILFYKTENGEVRVEILLFQENLWLTQAKMAELFEVQKAAISKHLKNIFESGELSEDSVVSKMETTAADGKRYQTNYYNLDAIIAVGYRVNSKKATMFRIWANRVLKEFIIKGYVMDDARLREPENFFGKDYFDEQLERIRDIRASERRFYQKITDIYSQCSADYDVESPITKEFFATVQNKLHYTENRFLSTLGVSIAWHHFNAIMFCLFPFCCHNRRIWHHPNISRSSRTLCSFLTNSSSVSVGTTACTCGGCSETKATSCNSSRIMRRTSSAVREAVPITSSTLPTAVTTNLLIEPYCFLSMACSLSTISRWRLSVRSKRIFNR